MTPLQFENAYGPLWQELEVALDRIEGNPVRPKGKPVEPKNRSSKPRKRPVDGARLAALYRRSCEHLALAKSRAYPIHLRERLESLTQRAHRVVYRRRDYGFAQLKRLVLIDFPQSVRAHRWYLLVATILFVLPTLVVGWATYRDPGFALHVMDAQQIRNFDNMYGDTDRAIGHLRDADTDWKMFGFYVMNNIGVAFQCFASGLFLGVGSAFFLVINGVLGGAAGGFVTARGYSENFYSFVVTHAAFELTAIVLSGAAGLRIGHALLAPGRRTRLESLKFAAKDAIVVIYGAIGMLLIAAGLEAFWSSARWVTPSVKYGVGALCWLLVLSYLTWQGRPARAVVTQASSDQPRVSLAN